MKQLVVKLAFVLAAFSVQTASATLVIHYDFDDLVGESDLIIHGRVLDQRSEWVDSHIGTFVELEVIECLRGDCEPGESMVVFRLGGLVDDLAMVVSGEAEFVNGEEVVVFLELQPGAPGPLVMGMAQGKFTIVADPVTEQRMITRDLGGLRLVVLDENELEQPIDPTDLIRLPLADAAFPAEPLWIPAQDFLSEVRHQLEQEGNR